MKTTHEFKQNELVTLINPKAAQELDDVDWPVPVISQYGQRVHCWNSQRREFTITLPSVRLRLRKLSNQTVTTTGSSTETYNIRQLAVGVLF